jgi:hypothetical protein
LESDRDRLTPIPANPAPRGAARPASNAAERDEKALSAPDHYRAAPGASAAITVPANSNQYRRLRQRLDDGGRESSHVHRLEVRIRAKLDADGDGIPRGRKIDRPTDGAIRLNGCRPCAERPLFRREDGAERRWVDAKRWQRASGRDDRVGPRDRTDDLLIRRHLASA